MFELYYLTNDNAMRYHPVYQFEETSPMRCPECNKFAAYDDSTEPEVEVEVDEDGNVTGSARIVLTHDECGTELKETTFDIDVEGSAFKDTDGVPFTDEEHKGDGHSLDIEGDNPELTIRRDATDKK